MTTAASVGCGRLRNSPGTATSISTIMAAPTRPVTWVLAPDCSATAVREPLVLTGNPWKSPAATFAVPMPIISWLACTSSPLRPANADAVEMVSVSATREIPSAPATSSPKSDAETLGIVNGGSPWGSVPTRATPWLARSNRTAAPMDATTATSTAGTLGSQRWSTRITASPNSPTSDGGGHGLAGADAVHEPGDVPDQGVGVHGEPAELRQLADQDGERETGHVADLGRLGEQVRHEAQLGHSGQDHHGADQEGEHRGQGDGPRRASVGTHQGEDRGGDHRTERRVGPEHQDPRGPEDGVPGEAQDRRVEAR